MTAMLLQKIVSWLISMLIGMLISLLKSIDLNAVKDKLIELFAKLEKDHKVAFDGAVQHKMAAMHPAPPRSYTK